MWRDLAGGPKLPHIWNSRGHIAFSLYSFYGPTMTVTDFWIRRKLWLTLCRPSWCQRSTARWGLESWAVKISRVFWLLLFPHSIYACMHAIETVQWTSVMGLCLISFDVTCTCPILPDSVSVSRPILAVCVLSTLVSRVNQRVDIRHRAACDWALWAVSSGLTGRFCEQC